MIPVTNELITENLLERPTILLDLNSRNGARVPSESLGVNC